MKTTVMREGDVTFIELSGFIDYESALPLKQSIQSVYKLNPQSKLVFNLAKLEFVGSSGVSNFVKLLAPFNGQNIKPSYFGVKSEFLKLFRAFEEIPFEILASREHAVASSLQRYREWEILHPRSVKDH